MDYRNQSSLGCSLPLRKYIEVLEAQKRKGLRNRDLMTRLMEEAITSPTPVKPTKAIHNGQPSKCWGAWIDRELLQRYRDMVVSQGVFGTEVMRTMVLRWLNDNREAKPVPAKAKPTPTGTPLLDVFTANDTFNYCPHCGHKL